MKRAERDAWISEALSLVEEGTLCQSKFRSSLSISFKNALGPNPEHPSWTVAQIVRADAEALGCHPRFDPKLLKLDWPSGR